MVQRAPETLVRGWRKAYLEWRVAHESELDAVAGVVAERVHDEHIWQVINDLLESAVRAGWDCASDRRGAEPGRDAHPAQRTPIAG